MLSMTFCKNCCIIVIELYHRILLASTSKLRLEEIDSVSKRESAIWQPYCLNVFLTDYLIGLNALRHFPAFTNCC